MMVRRSRNRVASDGASVINSTPNCSFADHRTGAIPTSMGVWFAEGNISNRRYSPFWTGVVLRMAHPSRDRLTTVPLHSFGPSVENKQGNSTGKRLNFLSSLCVSLGDEERVGGFDDGSECMKTTVLGLNGTSKLFLVMCVGEGVLSLVYSFTAPRNFQTVCSTCHPSFLQRVQRTLRLSSQGTKGCTRS